MKTTTDYTDFTDYLSKATINLDLTDSCYQRDARICGRKQLSKFK